MKYKKYNNINVGEATLGLWDKVILLHLVPLSTRTFPTTRSLFKQSKCPLFFLYRVMMMMTASCRSCGSLPFSQQHTKRLCHLMWMTGPSCFHISRWILSTPTALLFFSLVGSPKRWNHIKLLWTGLCEMLWILHLGICGFCWNESDKAPTICLGWMPYTAARVLPCITHKSHQYLHKAEFLLPGWTTTHSGSLEDCTGWCYRWGRFPHGTWWSG